MIATKNFSHRCLVNRESVICNNLFIFYFCTVIFRIAILLLPAVHASNAEILQRKRIQSPVSVHLTAAEENSSRKNVEMKLHKKAIKYLPKITTYRPSPLKKVQTKSNQLYAKYTWNEQATWEINNQYASGQRHAQRSGTGALGEHHPKQLRRLRRAG